MREIRTKRLLLRPFHESDCDDLFEFLSQLKDDEFEGYPGITYENGREYLQQRLGSEEFYTVVLVDSGKVIGNIYCGNRDYDAKKVGYIISRNCRRMGYAEEALSAVIESAFRGGVHRIVAECDPRNTASWKLLEKVGLQREAHFRQNIWFHTDENGAPIWKDTYVYAKLNTVSIRRLASGEIPAALDLAWRTFSEYESPDYSPEGTEEFRKCLHDNNYLAGIEYYGAFDEEKLIGEIGIRPDRMHICFFFVDGSYHRRGIGTGLFRYLRKIYPHDTITLNSSPYGLPFYKAIGFVPSEAETTVNGIRFTPMKHNVGGDQH
jgi:RimJ/RimL family protein N-acetyltransferase